MRAPGLLNLRRCGDAASRFEASEAYRRAADAGRRRKTPWIDRLA